MQIILGKVKRLVKLAKGEHTALETALRVAGGVAAHHPNPEVAALAKATANALDALSKALTAKDEADEG